MIYDPEDPGLVALVADRRDFIRNLAALFAAAGAEIGRAHV